MSIGLAIAGQAISGGINQAINSNNSKKEFKRQKELMGLQQQYQKDMWDYTNAENQVEHYKKAGLNVGLMYDKGGSSASTGSFGMSAPSQAPAQFGIDMNQAQQTQSVIELNQALADKARAEAENERGADRDNTIADTGLKITQTGNVKADTELKEITGRISELDEKLKGLTLEDSVELVKWNARMAEKEVESIGYRNKIDRATTQEQISKIKAESVGAWISNRLSEQGIVESKARVSKMVEDVAQGWQKLRIEERNTKVNEFKGQLEAQYPGVDKVMGGLWNNLIREFDDIFGVDTDKDTKYKRL